MGLALGQLEFDWQTTRIDQSMDLGGQPASAAPHAAGSKVIHTGGLGGRLAPLFALAPCWCTLMDELSMACRSPS